MFFLRHPKPVVDPRPVAELSLQAATLAPLASVALTATHSSTYGRETPICFTVRLRFREYFSIASDFMRIALRDKGKHCDRLGMGARLTLALTVCPLFFYKRLKVGSCRFTIDAQGITRHSRNGAIVVPWHEVLIVHALHQGYLVRKNRGAMPLPYRCFTAEERKRFDRWASQGA